MKWARTHPIASQFLIHIGNERKCSPWQGAMLKALGVKAGVSDYFLAYPASGYHGFWIELKAPGSLDKLSDAQEEWFILMQSVNFKTAVFDNPSTAIVQIIEYLGKNPLKLVKNVIE